MYIRQQIPLQLHCRSGNGTGGCGSGKWYLLILNLLSVVMRAAMGVLAVVRVGFRGTEIVAEGKGGNKEEDEEEREENTAEQRFEGGRIHGCGVG